jgi:hypothetical protein
MAWLIGAACVMIAGQQFADTVVAEVPDPHIVGRVEFDAEGLIDTRARRRMIAD